MAAPTSFFNLPALTDAKGKALEPVGLQGKVVLVVNVASKCGLTPQYKGLQALHDAHAAQGLVILGAPCNQFGGQEPGTEEEIVTFCSRNYDVTFPILSKLEVNGDNTHFLYQWLKSQPASLDPATSAPFDIQWNFAKFLIAPDGSVAKRFGPREEPSAVEPEIIKLLPQVSAA